MCVVIRYLQWISALYSLSHTPVLIFLVVSNFSVRSRNTAESQLDFFAFTYSGTQRLYWWRVRNWLIQCFIGQGYDLHQQTNTLLLRNCFLLWERQIRNLCEDLWWKAVTRDPGGETLLHLRGGQLTPKSCSEVLLVQIKGTAFHCKLMNIPFCDQGCCGFDDIHLIRESLVVS